MYRCKLTTLDDDNNTHSWNLRTSIHYIVT